MPRGAVSPLAPLNDAPMKPSRSYGIDFSSFEIGSRSLWKKCLEYKRVNPIKNGTIDNLESCDFCPNVGHGTLHSNLPYSLLELAVHHDIYLFILVFHCCQASALV